MKEKKKISTLTLAMIAEVIVIIALTGGIAKTISKATKTSTYNHMSTISEERAQIIRNYVSNAEKTLQFYSKAAQIHDLLENPTDKALAERAQQYTNDYSKDIDNLEGIYVSEFNTHVLAHTDTKYVGMITRKDPDSLKMLQDAMIAAGDGVYDTGMIISPATGQQIVSMYKAVYDDNGEPIGLVGLGIYTDRLIENLNNLTIKGINNSFYSMVNVNDGKYVFNDDPTLVGEYAENEEVEALCSQLKGTTDEATGVFEYKLNDIKYVSSYTYMKDNGWLLMIDTSKDDINVTAKAQRFSMIILELALIGLVFLFNFLYKKQQKATDKLASTIVKNNKTKESLYTAMFKDVLTEVNNRIAFSMNMDDAKGSNESPYYFAMFNICDFSNVNTRYGNDTGDWLLVRTVDVLKQVFKKGNIYRTGSDEFVVALQVSGKDNNQELIIEDVNDAYRRLVSQQNTPLGKISFKYRSAVVKKSTGLNSSIITVLKDMTNKNSDLGNNPIPYADLDRI
jgi:GGDEF domain-containing protein